MRQVRPKLDFIAPNFQPWILPLIHWSLPILLKLRLQPWLPAGISQIETINSESLAKLYQKFQDGQIRLLMAFRHCEVDDPLSGLYVLSRAVPQIARQQGIALQLPLHSHFMYDRGMPLWAGSWLGWLFARMGGVPIHRGKSLDWIAIKTIRSLLINGQFPLAVAPEGATNGHSEVVSPLEPGVAQLGFWCVEDLLKANRCETVWIVPIGIQYRYSHPNWRKLDALLCQLEKDCGLPLHQSDREGVEDRGEKLYLHRICRLAEHLLVTLENFYRRFYHQKALLLPDSTDAELDSNVRLQRLLDTALKVGEQYFALESNGSIIERCRRLEEVGWTYIYRQDISDRKSLSSLERGLGDWIAQEADLRMLHMRLVESFVAVNSDRLQEKLSFERLAEIALILFDLMARIKHEKVPRRPRLGWRSVRVTIGTPISVSDRWSHYSQSRSAAKQAVADLTQALQIALEKAIV